MECFKKISNFYFTCELEDLVSKETVVSDVDGEVRCENDVLIISPSSEQEMADP